MKSEKGADSPDSAGPARLDRWLWAARFYKTRALAVEAIDGGKVQINGHRVKRSRLVRPGDLIRLRQGPYEYRVSVLRVSDRRGPPPEAALLYQESSESREARERVAVQLKTVHQIFTPAPGRPTKRDRRELDRFRRGE